MRKEDLKLVLGDEEVVSFQFKKLKRVFKNPIINSEIKVVIKGKDEVHLIMKFTFKDMDIKIDGELNRTVHTNGEFENIEEDLRSIISDTKGAMFQPLYGKASKLVANITDESFLFPLIVPINTWYEDENSSVQIINETKKP